MQCFSLGVSEIAEIAYFICQWRSAYQVRVKHKAYHIRCKRLVGTVNIYYLPRTEAYNRSFLIIVIFSSIFQGAVHAVLQIQGIYSIVHSQPVETLGRFFQVYNRYKRMTGCQTI